MKVTVLYVGSSLLGPLRYTEREINRAYPVDLCLAVHNFGAAFTDDQWAVIENDLREAEVVFVIHVMDGENAARLLRLLDGRRGTTVVINCMPELMKRTRLGKLEFARLPGVSSKGQRAKSEEQRAKSNEPEVAPGGLLASVSSWIGRQAKGNGKKGASAHGRAEYLKWADRLPGLLRFVPNAGLLRDAKNYLLLVSYFLQPTPNNIRSMILLALKEYVDHERARQIDVPAPEAMPSVAIYHPDAPALFESFEAYREWYGRRSNSKFQIPNSKSGSSNSKVGSSKVGSTNSKVGSTNSKVGSTNFEVGRSNFEVGSTNSEVGSTNSEVGSTNSEVRSSNSEVGSTNSKSGTSNSEVGSTNSKVGSSSNCAGLDPQSTIGLLLMRPQIVSNSRRHYDGLIREIEAEGLGVIPVIATLMDNREACDRFFVGTQPSGLLPTEQAGEPDTERHARRLRAGVLPRVSQIVSLTGFSFVGGPAMNDSAAAADYLTELNIPYRSLVSLDTQTIESWQESFTGLNPVQTGMQVAIPEIDGGTEPFVFGGIPSRGVEPAPMADRCRRVARRLKRWHRLQTAPRDELRIALILYCFPPNKGNLGTAADLDVFASLGDILSSLRKDGYLVEVPESADALRRLLLGGNSEDLKTTANIAHRMPVGQYRRLCPFVDEIEREWGPAPGTINSSGAELLIQGITLGKVFLGVQPTFGFEDDPMRLLMAKGGTPHHGFAAFYAYLESVFRADAVVHVGTHGAMEFMPGKQVGLSGECWPDRLIGELPNIYLYSVNNPSEGTIAKRRSYAELVSYLTPPIENAGLYKGLAGLKDLVESYRSAATESERAELFSAIEEARKTCNIELSQAV